MNRETNFVLLGDLNTMGLKYPADKKADEKLAGRSELDYLDYYSTRRAPDSRGSASGKDYKARSPNLRRLTKPEGTEISTAFGISDLDHVLVSKHLKCRLFRDDQLNQDFEIKLDGWRQYSAKSERETFASEVSDHCLLYFEIEL